MGSEIIFSGHARYQMKERNLSENEIVATITGPNKVTSHPQQKFQAVKLTKRNGEKYLMVVIYRKTNSFKKVITAFLTSKIKKYLK